MQLLSGQLQPQTQQSRHCNNNFGHCVAALLLNLKRHLPIASITLQKEFAFYTNTDTCEVARMPPMTFPVTGSMLSPKSNIPCKICHSSMRLQLALAILNYRRKKKTVTENKAKNNTIASSDFLK